MKIVRIIAILPIIALLCCGSSFLQADMCCHCGEVTVCDLGDLGPGNDKYCTDVCSDRGGYKGSWYLE